MTEQILIPFEGKGSGVGELTWGQLEIWLAMQDQGTPLSIGGAFPLPPGTTVNDVAADLRFLMCRHASLRTRLRFTADGHMQQVLARSGEVPLKIVDSGDADPADIAARLHAQYEEKVFDHVNEWPIRWAVIVHRGVATHLVTSICHLAADGMSIMEMLAGLGDKDSGTGPATVLEPLELAEKQRTPAARRQNHAALRYLERTFRTIPARRFAESEDQRRPRYWQATYDSPASYLALQVLAARARVTTSTVLLAAFAAVLTRLTGNSPAVIQVVVDNRFRRDLVKVVSPLCMTVPCVIDARDTTFDQVIARAWQRSLLASKLAYYDPRDREALKARIEQERGEAIDLSCFINDRRMQSRGEPSSEKLPAAGDLRAALPRSELTWGYQRDMPSAACFLHINNVPDTLCLEINADTRYLSPADMAACLRGLEAVVVEAALEPI